MTNFHVNMLDMKEFTVTKNDAGQRLDRFAAKAAPSVPSSLLQKAFRKKDVKVNGHWARPDLRLSEGEFPSVVVADTDEYRRKNDARAVKKTVSIPAWMADRAERAGVSLSQTLQDALRKQFAAP